MKKVYLLAKYSCDYDSEMNGEEYNEIVGIFDDFETAMGIISHLVEIEIDRNYPGDIFVHESKEGGTTKVSNIQIYNENEEYEYYNLKWSDLYRIIEMDVL